MNASLLLAGILACFGWYWFAKRRRSAGYPLPPGPKRHFVSGNLHQLPSDSLWLTFVDWSKIYGPIIHFRVFSERTIVLNSGKVALDLLEHQSAIYSDRPIGRMCELAGRKDAVFTISPTEPRFKIYRKLLHAGLSTRALQSYRPIQYAECAVLLNNLVIGPQEFYNHIRRNAAAVIMKVAYGYQVESDEDMFISIIEEGVELLESVLTPGKFLVEFLPILQYIPSWFPGAGFKRFARKVEPRISRIENEPFIWAQKNIESGNFRESFTSKLLRPESGEVLDANQKDIIKWVSGGLYLGGAHTIVSVQTSFFYLMMCHPEFQKHAQMEIDQVLNGRLPVFEDYKSMPFVAALIRETTRWAPVAPLGIPRRVMKDDVYEGNWIPKGITILANIWAMTHDEEVYPEPSKFDPNRYLGDNPQTDPFQFIFGFGRRICPGMHLAEMQLFLNIASILATLNILKPLDENGHEYTPEPEFQSAAGTILLKPYRCRIVPRSNEAAQMINQ